MRSRKIDTLILNLFTFHYGPIQIIGTYKIFIRENNIYIPLWSYSNYKIIFNIILKNLFTFHYGPIKIFISQKAYDILKKFTFHYGPIQILYQFESDTEVVLIYIPLWSYSNFINL